MTQAEATARMSEGGKKGAATVRAQRVAGMAAAREWRESRRCACGALAYQSCAHRPDGLA